MNPDSTNAAPTPFTMVVGDPDGLVCEGDACMIAPAIEQRA